MKILDEWRKREQPDLSIKPEKLWRAFKAWRASNRWDRKLPEGSVKRWDFIDWLAISRGTVFPGEGRCGPG